MSVRNVLSLKTYCFLKQLNESVISLTPLSQQIKQNIANEWIKSIRRLSSLQVFVTPFVSHLDPLSRHQINSLKAILDNYNNYYRLWSEGSDETIGVIQRVVCLKDNKILNDTKNDGLVFAMFCPKHESLYWFQKLQGIHNQWFRNLSKSPLNSKFMTEVKENTQKWCLSYKTEELSPELETIEYFSDSLTEKTFGLSDCDIISSQIDLDNALIAFLCDAFIEKVYKNGKTVKKMKIHSSLAPFKIAFTFRDNTEVNDVLLDLTKYMIQSLKLLDIPVLPFTPNKPISIESYDELGIPFTVILDNQSTHNGLVALRNRDSDIEESLHISRLQQTICLNLNAIHPSVVRNKF